MVIVTDIFKGNRLSPHRLLFPISSKGSFICTFSQTCCIYHIIDEPVVDHWLERKIAQTANLPTRQARLDDPNLYRQVLYCLSDIPPPIPFWMSYSVLYKQRTRQDGRMSWASVFVNGHQGIQTHGFETSSGQTNHLKIDTCRFLTRRSVLLG